MPRTERKKHTSFTFSQGELEAIDRWAERMGPGTYRNEAVMAAVYRALGESAVTNVPAQRPGFQGQVAHVPGGPGSYPAMRTPGVQPKPQPGERVTIREEE